MMSACTVMSHLSTVFAMAWLMQCSYAMLSRDIPWNIALVTCTLHLRLMCMLQVKIRNQVKFF